MMTLQLPATRVKWLANILRVHRHTVTYLILRDYSNDADAQELIRENNIATEMIALLTEKRKNNEETKR